MGLERLSGDNKYNCEKCGHLVEAERSITYQKMPNVLSIQINRFAYSFTYVHVFE